MATSRTSPIRGRPPLTWHTPDALLRLPIGTAVTLELRGAHARRTTGRIGGRTHDELTVELVGGRQRILTRREIARGRIVNHLFDAGEPVLRVGVPAHTWRGGVVRSLGRQVLVEQVDGSFAWLDEAELERPDDQVAPAPRLPRGPVPSTRTA